MCLKNAISKKEQIFSLNLDEFLKSGIIKFHGDVKDLFAKKKVNISVLRKIGSNFYQDILSSYNSILTQTLGEKNKKKGTDDQDSSEIKHIMRSKILNNLKTFKTFKSVNSESSNYSLNNYTIFSFLNVKSKPYLKIKKKSNHIMKDNQDVHIKITNLEKMASFMVNIKIRSKCSIEKKFPPKIQYLAVGKLRTINKYNYITEKKKKEATNALRNSMNNQVSDSSDRKDIRVNWAVEKMENWKSFYKSGSV